MVKNNRNDLRINGLGNSSGGSYKFVQVNGKGDIDGDLECDELQINGLGCVHGNVKTNTVRVAGKSEISGNLDGHDFVIDGMTEVGGTVSAGHIENRGMLKISKDCNSEAFRSQGGFVIGGLLNADKVDITTYVFSKAREIGGEEIEIRAGSGFGLKKFLISIFPNWQIDQGLTADTIEGDTIYLENATVKVVRGKDVKIGPGCHIDNVEYRNTYHQDAGATVKQNKKV